MPVNANARPMPDETMTVLRFIRNLPDSVPVRSRSGGSRGTGVNAWADRFDSMHACAFIRWRECNYDNRDRWCDRRLGRALCSSPRRRAPGGERGTARMRRRMTTRARYVEDFAGRIADFGRNTLHTSSFVSTYGPPIRSRQ